MNAVGVVRADRGSIVQLAVFASWSHCSRFFTGLDDVLALFGEFGPADLIHHPEGPAVIVTRESRGLQVMLQPTGLSIRTDKPEARAWLVSSADRLFSSVSETLRVEGQKQVGANAVWAAPVRDLHAAAAELTKKCGASFDWTGVAGGEPSHFWRQEAVAQPPWRVNIAFGPATLDSKAASDTLPESTLMDVLDGMYLDDPDSIDDDLLEDVEAGGEDEGYGDVPAVVLLDVDVRWEQAQDEEEGVLSPPLWSRTLAKAAEIVERVVPQVAHE